MNKLHLSLKRLLAIYLFLILTSAAFGQQKGIITGKILTQKNEPAENVSVSLKGTRYGTITDEEGNELLAIIQRQDVSKIKEGAYHALCGKKFLANNYQPVKARGHVRKAIGISPLRLDNYLLYAVSYLPETLIAWLHKKSPNRL